MFPSDVIRYAARCAASILVISGFVGCTGGGSGDAPVAPASAKVAADSPPVSAAPPAGGEAKREAAPVPGTPVPTQGAVLTTGAAASAPETPVKAAVVSALPEKKPAGGASTPKELLDKFVAALQAGDKEAIFSCLDRSSPNAELMATAVFGPTIDVLNGRRDFRDALEAKFGPEFAKGISILPPQMDLTKGFDTLREKIATAEIREDGDTAKITIPGETADSPMQLTKRDGSWFLVPRTDQLPPADKIDMTKSLMASLAGAYEKSAVALKSADDPEAYKKQFQQIQNELMMKMMAAAAAAQQNAPGAGTPKLPIPGGQ